MCVCAARFYAVSILRMRRTRASIHSPRNLEVRLAADEVEVEDNHQTNHANELLGGGGDGVQMCPVMLRCRTPCWTIVAPIMPCAPSHSNHSSPRSRRPQTLTKAFPTCSHAPSEVALRHRPGKMPECPPFSSPERTPYSVASPREDAEPDVHGATTCCATRRQTSRRKKGTSEAATEEIAATEEHLAIEHSHIHTAMALATAACCFANS